MKEYFKVNIIKSEGGWGERLEDDFSFKTLEAANNFVKEYTWNIKTQTLLVGVLMPPPLS